MARKKFKASKLDTKLMVDVIGASLIVQQVPALLQSWFSLDSQISKIGAVGVGYVVGSMINRPTISNASIALFASDMLIPLIGNILPSSPSKQLPMTPPAPKSLPVPIMPPQEIVSVDDYFRLNDYIPEPAQSIYSDYRNIY